MYEAVIQIIDITFVIAVEDPCPIACTEVDFARADIGSAPVDGISEYSVMSLLFVIPVKLNRAKQEAADITLQTTIASAVGIE